jgi:hypothetical protein
MYTHPRAKVIMLQPPIRPKRGRLALGGIVVLTALAGAAPALATPAPTTPAHRADATTQGIIMRDGGICDPIRHMGC